MKHASLLLVVPSLFLLASCGTAPAAPVSSDAPASAQASSASKKFVPPPVMIGSKLSDTPDAKNAFLISEGPLTDAAKIALTGYTVQIIPMSDGSKTIILLASDPAYHNQTYTLKPGQKLYFVERFAGDDKNDKESFPGDDIGVVTGSDGTIVSSGQ